MWCRDNAIAAGNANAGGSVVAGKGIRRRFWFGDDVEIHIQVEAAMSDRWKHQERQNLSICRSYYKQFVIVKPNYC